MGTIWRDIDGFFSGMMPPVTRRIFYAVWIVFLIQTISAAVLPNAAAFPGTPAQVASGSLFEEALILRPWHVVPLGMVWKLFTYAFLHASFSHILFNSLGLFFFGAPVERALGQKRYLWMLIIAIVAGGVLHTALYWGASLIDRQAYFYIGALGISGAVFAILVGCMIFAPNMVVYLNFLFPVKMKWLVTFYLLYELYSFWQHGLFSPVSHVGHLTGAAVAFLFIKWPQLYGFLPGFRRGPRAVRGGRVVKSRKLSMGHPGRSGNADDRYDDPHWKLDQ